MTGELKAQLEQLALLGEANELPLAAAYCRKKAAGHLDIIDDPAPRGVPADFDDEFDDAYRFVD